MPGTAFLSADAQSVAEQAKPNETAEKRRERETQLQSRHEAPVQGVTLRPPAGTITNHHNISPPLSSNRQQLDETEQLLTCSCIPGPNCKSFTHQAPCSVAEVERAAERLSQEGGHVDLSMGQSLKLNLKAVSVRGIARRQMQLQELQGRRSTKFQKQRQEAQALFATLASKRETAMVISASHVQQKCKSASEQATQKDDRVETLAFERQKMWETRRAAQIEAHKILRSAKSEVLKQTMKPKDCLKWLSEQLDRMSANPRAIGGPSSSSSPSRSAPSSPWNLSTSAFPEDRLFEQRAAGVDPSAIHLLSTCTTGS
ncbi:unnamed protein product [Polarella glacialis]|uniref:Uncharacterized protein n=1 Tax=Polarella glacialis TaxID=89957 RepID=A0A813FW56_POLGL|nr:unnamed protein product [Polarella glacialis]